MFYTVDKQKVVLILNEWTSVSNTNYWTLIFYCTAVPVLHIYCNPNRSVPSISDGFLFYLSGRGTQKHGRRRVVRSREEVQSTLAIYHNDMNHLGLEKCLKLISQHFFWGSMRADVALWIQRCSKCSSSDDARGVESCASPELPEPLENMLDQDRYPLSCLYYQSKSDFRNSKFVSEGLQLWSELL